MIWLRDFRLKPLFGAQHKPVTGGIEIQSAVTARLCNFVRCADVGVDDCSAFMEQLGQQLIRTGDRNRAEVGQWVRRAYEIRTRRILQAGYSLTAGARHTAATHNRLRTSAVHRVQTVA